MSTFSYIRATGDQDYNFNLNDFTVEFFAETSNANAYQTLVEITNNESPAANLFATTSFYIVLESGNISSYATNNANILFQIQGNEFSANTLHFISAERCSNVFYLFLDGQSQATPVTANVPIPAQILANIANANSTINRFDSPALLTIGADSNGQNPLYGKFGDIKIVNGNAAHVNLSQSQNIVYSSFNQPYLGTHPADIIVSGGTFVDSTTSYGPEELVNGQMFDTLFIQVYQSNISNSSSNILSFIFFKPTIMAGPIGSYQFVVGSTNVGIAVPWTTLDAAAASVLVNGNALPASGGWSITNSVLTINAVSGSNVDIISTGPTYYYAVGANTVSTITSNVYTNSTTINVANISGFMTPTANYRGQVFIDQECITYSNITGNTLYNLVRGTSGTGVPNIHIANSRIICASHSDDIQTVATVDPRPFVWYTTPFNNTSLQNTNTTISNVLLAFGGISPEATF
jgi:hypothetical protein